MRHVGNGVMKPDNPGSLLWQEHVAAIAGNAWAATHGPPGLGVFAPYAGPVALSGAFLFARPAGDTSDYPIGHSGAYDGDKLIRNVADALSAHGSRGAKRCKSACRKHGGVLADDRIIVNWGPWLVRWADLVGLVGERTDHGPGALIEVRAL